MKSERRHKTTRAVVAGLVCVLAILVPLCLARAQDQKTKGTTPSPEKQTGAKSQTGPVSQQAVTPQQPSRQRKLPGSEVEGPVIVNTDLVTLTVTVTDNYGRYVSGLNKNAFTVFEDKQPQEITFFSDDDAPVSVGIVFDRTGSMGGDKIRRAREALAHFIQTSHDADEYFLIAFNTSVQLLADRTRDGTAVLNQLTFVNAHGNTALYDAVYVGLERVTHGTHSKKAILVISDGQDNSSRYTFSELKRALKETDVVIYAIGILSGSDAGSDLGMGGQAILEEMAGVSGGKAFFPRSSAEMDDIFEQIALELRHQYSIGYKPANFVTDGKWHRVKVKVSPPRGLPRLFVRSKDGYYATAGQR